MWGRPKKKKKCGRFGWTKRHKHSRKLNHEIETHRRRPLHSLKSPSLKRQPSEKHTESARCGVACRWCLRPFFLLLHIRLDLLLFVMQSRCWSPRFAAFSQLAECTCSANATHCVCVCHHVDDGIYFDFFCLFLFSRLFCYFFTFFFLIWYAKIITSLVFVLMQSIWTYECHCFYYRSSKYVRPSQTARQTEVLMPIYLVSDIVMCYYCWRHGGIRARSFPLYYYWPWLNRHFPPQRSIYMICFWSESDRDEGPAFPIWKRD